MPKETHGRPHHPASCLFHARPGLGLPPVGLGLPRGQGRGQRGRLRPALPHHDLQPHGECEPRHGRAPHRGLRVRHVPAGHPGDRAAHGTLHRHGARTLFQVPARLPRGRQRCPAALPLHRGRLVQHGHLRPRGHLHLLRRDAHPDCARNPPKGRALARSCAAS